MISTRNILAQSVMPVMVVMAAIPCLSPFIFLWRGNASEVTRIATMQPPAEQLRKANTTIVLDQKISWKFDKGTFIQQRVTTYKADAAGYTKVTPLFPTSYDLGPENSKTYNSKKADIFAGLGNNGGQYVFACEGGDLGELVGVFTQGHDAEKNARAQIATSLPKAVEDTDVNDTRSVTAYRIRCAWVPGKFSFAPGPK